MNPLQRRRALVTVLAGGGAAVSPPAQPTGLTATPASNSQIDLSWTDAADNETAYKVYRSTDGETYAQVGDDLAADANSYSDTSVSAVDYWYKVAAVNDAGETSSDAVAVAAGTYVLTLQPDGTVGLDTYLRSSASTTNYGSTDQLRMGALGQYVSLLKFSGLSQIPAGSNVASGTLTLWLRDACTADMIITIRRILAANSGWTEAGATHNTIDGTNAWAGGAGCTISGVDHAAASMGSGAVENGKLQNTSFDIVLDADELELLLASNSGIIGYSNVATVLSILSSDTVTAGQRPQLSVTFDSLIDPELTEAGANLLALRPENQTADVVIDITISTLETGKSAGVFLCLDSATNPKNFIRAYHSETQVILDKCVGGTYTNLITASSAYGNDLALRVIKSGSAVQVYVNGVQINTNQLVSDAGIVDNTLYGTFSTGANTLTGFSATSPVSAGEPTHDGILSSIGEPHVLRHAGAQDRTYICTMDSSGNANIHAYDHNSGVMDGPYLLHTVLDVDDHASPSVIVRSSDSKLLTVYSAHNGVKIYGRISSAAENPSAWGNEIDVTTGEQTITYPSLIELTGESKIYCFYRNPAGVSEYRALCFVTSSDDGATWSGETVLCQLQSGSAGVVFTYWRIHQTGNRIDFAVSGHPTDGGTSSVYHFYYEAGSYYKTDGTEIVVSMPFTEDDITLVYSGASVQGWAWDVMTSEGDPIITFSTHPEPGDTRYNYAKWSGTEWVITEICTAGAGVYPTEPYAAVGMSLDRSNPNTVWAARYIAASPDIWKYTTADGGATWTPTQITSAADYEFRPVVPRNADASLPVVWFVGRFTTYEDYLTYIKLYLPA